MERKGRRKEQWFARSRGRGSDRERESKAKLSQANNEKLLCVLHVAK